MKRALFPITLALGGLVTWAVARTPARDACRDWWGCAELGLCHSRGPTCVARSDADCADTWTCREHQACAMQHGFCRAPDAPPVPDRSGPCAATPGCVEGGTCHRVGDRCLALTDADCAAAPLCRAEGRCDAQFGFCVASHATCAAMPHCVERKEGCAAVHGSCDLPPTPFIYFQF
jgi:hypothetical protein